MTDAQAVAQIATQMLIDDYRKTDRAPTQISEVARNAFVQYAWTILNEAQRQQNTVGRAVDHVGAPTAESQRCFAWLHGDPAYRCTLSVGHKGDHQWERAWPDSEPDLVCKWNLHDALHDGEWERAAEIIVTFVNTRAGANVAR